jgi:hypothetical protein
MLYIDLSPRSCILSVIDRLTYNSLQQSTGVCLV